MMVVVAQAHPQQLSWIVMGRWGRIDSTPGEEDRSENSDKRQRFSLACLVCVPDFTSTGVCVCTTLTGFLCRKTWKRDDEVLCNRLLFFPLVPISVVSSVSRQLSLAGLLRLLGLSHKHLFSFPFFSLLRPLNCAHYFHY